MVVRVRISASRHLAPNVRNRHPTTKSLRQGLESARLSAAPARSPTVGAGPGKLQPHFTYLRIVPIGHRLDEFMRMSGFGRFNDGVHVTVGIAICDIVADRIVE
jgi:hypothetical protein